MSRITLVVTTLALAAAMLGGCISSDDVDADGAGGTPNEAEDVRVTDTTGSLQGTVSSELFEPLGGATVTIVETEEEARVARSGEFVINNLDPGRYTLFVQALGFKAATRAVDIVAGEVTPVSIKMERLPSNDPWVDTQDHVGLVSWAVAWQLEGPVGCVIIPSPALLDVKNCGGLRGGGSINGEIELNVTDDVKTILVEMVWDPAGPLGEHLQIDLMCPEVPRGNGGAVLDTEHVCYWDTPGRESPLVHRVDEQHWLDNGYNFTGDWAARVFATYGLLGTYELINTDVGVAYEQSFTIYTNVFHKEAAPDGFSGIPDQ